MYYRRSALGGWRPAASRPPSASRRPLLRFVRLLCPRSVARKKTANREPRATDRGDECTTGGRRRPLLRFVRSLRCRSRAHDLHLVPRHVDCNLVAAHGAVRSGDGRRIAVDENQMARHEVGCLLSRPLAAWRLLEQYNSSLCFDPFDFTVGVEIERGLLRGQRSEE